MLLKLDPTGGLPLYRQIASAVRRAIRDGDVQPGDRLPAARDLAASLGVNMHTVVRAFGLLREEGLLEVRRGRGAIVAAGSSEAAGVQVLARDLADEARRQGYTLDEVVDIITKEFS
jgi:DNA-binding transcriptional regulator YhcF (GntR family)